MLLVKTLKQAATLGMGGETVRDSPAGWDFGRMESAIIFEALATGVRALRCFSPNMAV
jgi:hypothetical protein